MTLNLHKGLGILNRRFILPAMRDAVRAISADIVFLQEVVGEHEGLASRFKNWPSQGQYEYLADSIWPEYAYGKNAVADGSHHGNAILTKHQIVAWTNQDISFTKGEARGVLHCTLDSPSTREHLHVCCIHLGLSGRERRYQLQELCKYIRTNVPEHSPLIIAGDFNDWREHACTFMKYELGMLEAVTEKYGKPARTFPVRMPMLRLDRVYFRNLDMVDAHVLRGIPWSRLSDHAPLMVDIKLCS